MTKESAMLDPLATQIAEMFELIAHMHAAVREMHAITDRIEGHLQRIDEILQEALGRGGGGREVG